MAFTLQIVNTSPAQNSFNVPTQPTITVTFNAAVDPTTVNAGCLSVMDVNAQIILGANPTTISITGNTLSFCPLYTTNHPALSSQSSHLITVAAGVGDIAGHTLPVPISWAFTTGLSEGVLPEAPVISTPVSGAYVSPTAFVVSWNAIAAATNYQVAVSADRTFSTLAIPLITVVSTTTGTIGTTLPAGQYFVRVCAVSPAGTSPWSDAIVIVYDMFLNAQEEPPIYGSLWESPFGFTIVSSNPTCDSSNITPNPLQIYFSNPLPTALTVLPTVQIDPLYGNWPETFDATTWSVNPTNPCLLECSYNWTQNAMYTITFPANFADAAGSPLVGTMSIWFCTEFSCLYLTPRQLRMRLGEAASFFTDSQLYFQIFIASVNYNIWQLNTTNIALSEAFAPLTPVTADITEATASAAVIAVLDERIKEMMAMGSEKIGLGDFSITHTHDNIALLQQLKEEASLESLTLIDVQASILSSSLSSVSNASKPVPRRTF